MSARVNLLPRELEERAQARRTASWTIGGVAAFVALLGVLYIAKLGDLNAARDQRDTEQAEVAQLESDLAALEEFAELDRQVTARNQLLTAAMGTEVSWARVMNDLALTFPPSSSLTSLTIGPEEADPAQGEATAPAADGDSIATMSFDGYSVERYAPGVERVLVKFDEVEIFFNAYLSEAADDDADDDTGTTFNGTLQLNSDAYTGRYAEGLPPEVGR